MIAPVNGFGGINPQPIPMKTPASQWQREALAGMVANSVSDTVAVSSKKPKFGFLPIRPGMFLNIFDLAVPWESTVAVNKLMYASVISSRIVGSRTSNERNEVLRRDPLGWSFWFYGNPLMQTALILLGTSATQKPLLYNKMAEPTHWFDRLFWKFDPTNRFTLTSDVQLKQTQKQLVDAMTRKGIAPKLIEETQGLFRKTLNIRYLISFLGLMFSFAALGWGITALNIAMTRSAVAQKRQAELKEAGSGSLALRRPKN